MKQLLSKATPATFPELAIASSWVNHWTVCILAMQIWMEVKLFHAVREMWAVTFECVVALPAGPSPTLTLEGLRGQHLGVLNRWPL